MAKCSNFSEIEGKVSLKRRILPKGLENVCPTYPGSHLSRVYCIMYAFQVKTIQQSIFRYTFSVKNQKLRNLFLFYLFYVPQIAQLNTCKVINS